MSRPGLFVLIEPLASQGPTLLDPQAAQKHLDEHVAWEERRLARHCCWSLAVTAVGGAASLFIGWLWLLFAAMALSVGLLVVEKRRWHSDRRRFPSWLIQALANWLGEQEDLAEATRTLRNTEGSLDWRRLAEQAIEHANSNRG